MKYTTSVNLLGNNNMFCVYSNVIVKIKNRYFFFLKIIGILVIVTFVFVIPVIYNNNILISIHLIP